VAEQIILPTALLVTGVVVVGLCLCVHFFVGTVTLVR